jgi:hypothetical protein
VTPDLPVRWSAGPPVTHCGCWSLTGTPIQSYNFFVRTQTCAGKRRLIPLNVGRLARHLVGPLIVYRVGRKCGKIESIMDPNNSITAAVFAAFAKCPTKAHLLAHLAPILPISRPTYHLCIKRRRSAG